MLKKLTVIAAACFAISLLAVVELRADEGIPKQVLKRFQYFKGEWTAKGTTSKGEQASMTLKCMLVPGKHAVIINGTWKDPEVTAKGTAILGWDALEKKIHTSEFWDNNVYHHRHFTVKSDKIWEGEEFSGNTFEGETQRGKFRFEFINDNEFTLVGSDLVFGGKPQKGAVKLTFQRKKK